jgi:hypothetical protein
LPFDDHAYDGINAEQRSSMQDKRCDRSRQIRGAQQSADHEQRAFDNTLANAAEPIAFAPPVQRRFFRGFAGSANTWRAR